MCLIKNTCSLFIIFILFGILWPFTANSNDLFNLPPIIISDQEHLNTPILVWHDVVKTAHTFPGNIQSGCISAYSSSVHRGCVESILVYYHSSKTAAFRVRLEKRSQVVSGVTYHLGMAGDIVAGVKNLNNGNQRYNIKQTIQPDFDNPNIQKTGYNFGAYQANYCGALSSCNMKGIAFLAGNTDLKLYVIIPNDLLDKTRYEFNNLSLASLQLEMGTWNNGKFETILDTRRIEFLFSGSIEVDRRCYVSVDKSQLSFSAIRSNADNGVVGHEKVTVTSTCNNLGHQTVISLRLAPVNVSSVENNIMTLATSANGHRALGILFDNNHYPTQCEGKDSQPFYSYLLLGTHEPNMKASRIQRDIHFSLCKYGIPTLGQHTAALDMYIHWQN